MEVRKGLRGLAVVLALGFALFTSQGCASPPGGGGGGALGAVGRYFLYRGQDALEMIDLGVSLSYKPCIGLYWNSLDVLTFGFCDIDGYFVGIGGNQVGFTRMYAKCAGFIVSEEKVGWGWKFDKDNDSTLYTRYGGLAGLASLAGHSTPDYTPACVHFIPHIGFVGLVWNARWTQIVDFVLGWTTLDLGGDDGYQFGEWPGVRHTRN